MANTTFDGNLTTYFSNNYVWIRTGQRLGLAAKYFKDPVVVNEWHCVISGMVQSKFSYGQIPCEASEMPIPQQSVRFLCEIV